MYSIEVREVNGRLRYLLNGREVHAGDVVEVQTTTGQWLTAHVELIPNGLNVRVNPPPGEGPPDILEGALCRWPVGCVLKNAKRKTFPILEQDWRQLLRLAAVAGFPLREDTDVFSAAEVRALCCALQDTLPDIPHPPCSPESFTPSSPLDYFAPRRELLQEFLTFAHCGAFAVVSQQS